MWSKSEVYNREEDGFEQRVVLAVEWTVNEDVRIEVLVRYRSHLSMFVLREVMTRLIYI